MKQYILKFYFLSLFLISASLCQGQIPAFPGAEGFGRFVTGGRGGRVIEVTHPGDNGPGSLRNAIEEKGARTVIFRISGTIALASELIIKNGDLTIAGQTAPGDGICIKNYQMLIRADNVIIRYLRIRPGDQKQKEGDALSAVFQKDIIIDHCSFSWGNDEVATIRDNENTTLQWCIISESLNHSSHHKGDHGYGGIWGGKGATFHHNLIAHHTSRNPRFNGSRYHGQPEKEIVDFRNNVIYNWGFNSAYGGEGGSYNMVGNYYKPGPATKADVKTRIVEPWDAQGKWYVSDNFIAGYPEISANNWAGGVASDSIPEIRVDTPFQVSAISEQTAAQAYESVLNEAGAVLPVRDMVDLRIVREVRSGTASNGGVWGEATGIIDSPIQAGGWPELRTGQVPVDSDHDGMPDSWEIEQGLNPSDPADKNDHKNGDGYTNLENYLNFLAFCCNLK